MEEYLTQHLVGWFVARAPSRPSAAPGWDGRELETAALEPNRRRGAWYRYGEHAMTMQVVLFLHQTTHSLDEDTSQSASATGPPTSNSQPSLWGSPRRSRTTCASHLVSTHKLHRCVHKKKNMPQGSLSPVFATCLCVPRSNLRQHLPSDITNPSHT